MFERKKRKKTNLHQSFISNFLFESGEYVDTNETDNLTMALILPHWIRNMVWGEKKDSFDSSN